MRFVVFLRSSSIKAYGDLKSFRGMASRAGVSVASPDFSTNASTQPKFGSTKLFAPYTIFKGKASLSADVRLPTFSKLESGGYKRDRSGSIMLTFMPAIGERKYDRDKKQLFALSATEVGSLISLGSKVSCEFFHDPSMKSSKEGQVRKTLSIKAHDDGNGYFFTLSVANNLLKTTERLSVPVTAAEFAVLQSTFTFALPQLLGWDQFNHRLPLSDGETTSTRPVPGLPDIDSD